MNALAQSKVRFLIPMLRGLLHIFQGSLLPLLILIWTLGAVAQQAAKSATNSIHLIFSGTVQGGQDYQQHIGGDLIFQLKLVSKGGWEIQIVPEANPALDPDYSEVVTLPYNVFQPRYLYPGWGYNAKDVLALSPRKFQFLVNPSDYGSLALLWSAYENGGLPDAAAQTQQAIGSVAKGTGTLTILSGKLREPKSQEDLGSLQAIDFRVDLALPCDFAAPPPMTGLTVNRSACPQKAPAH